MAPQTCTALLALALAVPAVCAEPSDHLEESETDARSVPQDTPGNARPDCKEPFAGLGQTLTASSEHLRALAADCANPELGSLFYNRAYHADVVADLSRLAQLQKGYASNDQRRLESTRIFVALVEIFAEKAWHDAGDAVQAETIRALSQAYDMTIEDVELTIRGFDLLVGRSLEAP